MRGDSPWRDNRSVYYGPTRRSSRGKSSWVGTVSLPSCRDVSEGNDARPKLLGRGKPYHKPLIFRRHANRGSLKVGQVLNQRYEIIDCVGEGTTATVLEAWDMRARESVIIKIQKASDYPFVMREIDILRAVCDTHSKDISVIRLLDWFELPDAKGICIVFEKGLLSLWDYMKKRSRFCLSDIQRFGVQLLDALQKVHDLGITHADLKPENLVFVPAGPSPRVGEGSTEVSLVIEPDSQGTYPQSIMAPESDVCMMMRGRWSHEFDEKDLKLIDFGLAVFEHSPHNPVVGTRAYSPPEVVLEHGWSTPLDIWGLGCVLLEMYTGRTMFASHDDIEQMALFENTLGPIPLELIEKTQESKRSRMFSPAGLVSWQEYSQDPHTARRIDNQQPLLHYFHPDDVLFYDLISRMLCYDPEERITAAEALLHPFFTKQCECTCKRDGVYTKAKRRTKA